MIWKSALLLLLALVFAGIFAGCGTVKSPTEPLPDSGTGTALTF